MKGNRGGEFAPFLAPENVAPEIYIIKFHKLTCFVWGNGIVALLIFFCYCKN